MARRYRIGKPPRMMAKLAYPTPMVAIIELRVEFVGNSMRQRLQRAKNKGKRDKGGFNSKGGSRKGKFKGRFVSRKVDER